MEPHPQGWQLNREKRRLRERFPRLGSRSAMVNIVRYADDFIITGRTKELLDAEVKPLVAEFFKSRGLELSQEKTRITCHKIIWRVYGGTDNMSNRAILHPSCHSKVHNRELEVVKPRLVTEALSEA